MTLLGQTQAGLFLLPSRFLVPLCGTERVPAGMVALVRFVALCRPLKKLGF